MIIHRCDKCGGDIEPLRIDQNNGWPILYPLHLKNAKGRDIDLSIHLGGGTRGMIFCWRCIGKMILHEEQANPSVWRPPAEAHPEPHTPA